MATSRWTNRREVLDALATTCSSHVKTLKAVANAYLGPLGDSRVLSQGELISIFRTLTDMRNVMNKLNGVIQAASEDDNVANGVAQVANEFIVAKSALLEVYLPYARGHDAALRTLRAALSRPDVARAIDGIASSDERVRGESLDTLLESPLAFVGELRRLLSALVSLCTPADRGFSALQDAQELFAAIGREAAAAGYGAETLTSGLTAGTLASSPVQPRKLDVASPGASASLALAALSSPATGLGSTLPPTSTSTAAVVSAAMPLVPSTLSSDLKGSEVSVDAVLAAQADADEAARRLAELERHVALKEEELSLAQKEVVAAEEAARARGKGTSSDPLSSHGPGVSPMDEALRKLKDEERDLFDRMRNSEHRAVFEAFLARKQELEAEEARLTAALAEHEDTLAQVRARLANPPASVLPADPAKASLYIAWKKALAEREELLRAARRRKHELLKDLKARHETQVVLLELERRSAVESLKDAVSGERSKVDAYKRDLAALDESIEAARSSMKKFRQEFEQLRVALLIDRMAKSTQIANLADRRARLAKEAESFQEAVEAARQRIAAEETAKWEAKLAAAKEEGEKRVSEERRAIEAKIDKVRQALAERFEAGFRPLLKEAEQRHVAELQRVVELQKELEAKEAELRAAHDAARGISAAAGPGSTGLMLDGAGAALTGPTGQPVDPVTGAPVPEWKLREFEDLKAAVASMWEQLDVPAEEVTAFLSEADLMAPYSPEVLEMYQDMYRRLTAASTAGAAAALPAGAASQRSPLSGPAVPLSQTAAMAAHATPAQAAVPPAVPSTTPAGRPGVSPLPMSAARSTPAAQAAAASRPATAAAAGRAKAPAAFRSTGFDRKGDDDAYFLAKAAKSVPASLGGPGARANASPPRR